MYSRNTYKTSNINIENKKTQNNIESKTSIDQLSKIDSLKNQDVEKFIKRIQDEVQKAQLIAINIVKGKKISKDELEFITKKYPGIKQIADESIKDYKNLIKELEVCKIHEERYQLISKATKAISDMVKNGYISEVQSKIKIPAIEDAIKFNEKIKLETEKAETIALKIIKGENVTSNEEKFINEKCPNIKLIVEEIIKEVRNLKSDLKNCKIDKETQKLLLNQINDLEDKNKRGLLSKTEFKIKLSALEEVERFF